MSTVNSITTQLASIYGSNNQLLADTLSRIASGKKVSKPSDDYISYIRAQGIQDDINSYKTVTEDLTEAKQVSDTAAELGNNIYEDLVRMKELAEKYATSGSDTDKASYNIEFKALAQSISSMISTNDYDGTAIVSAATVSSVEIDPEDETNTIDLTFVAGDITDIATNASLWHLDVVGEEAAKSATNVQTEIDKALSYLNKAQSFQTQVDRQLDLTDTIVQNKGSLKSLLTDINDVEELNNATTLQIRQQAAVAMMAQANMMQSSIASLYSSGF